MVKNVWKSNPWPLKAAKIAYRCGCVFWPSNEGIICLQRSTAGTRSDCDSD